MPFSQAVFNGYATGDELHLGVTALDQLEGLTGASAQLNSLDQALSSASTSTAGLTSGITSELHTLIQPAQAGSVKAFNLGSGLDLSLGSLTNQVTGTLNSLLSTVNQVVPVPSISLAPPNTPASKGEIGPIDIPGLLHADALGGEAQAAWPGTACPTGNLSYGLGYLAGASVLPGVPGLAGLPGLSSLTSLTSTGLVGPLGQVTSLLPGTGSLASGVSTLPLLGTSGSGGLAVSQTKSLTSMVSNGDGSYGIQTQAQDVLAPLSLNLLGLAQLNVGVHAANGNLDPITLTATTSGEQSVPASLKMSSDDIIDVTMSLLGGTPVSLLHMPISAIGADGFHRDLTITGLVNGLAGLNVPNLLVGALNQVITGLQQVASSTPVAPVISQLQGAVNTLTGVLNQVGTQASSVINQVVQTPTVQQLLDLIQGTLTLNLGHIDIDTVPHAIGNPNAPAVASADGKTAGGALDLVNLRLGLTKSSLNFDAVKIGSQLINAVNGVIPVGAGAIPGLSNLPAFNIPALSINLPEIQLANPVLGHLEATSTQQSPIACTVAASNPPAPQQAGSPTPAPHAPAALPFTGGPGGLWQPTTGIALLGVGGGTMALIRRLRKRSGS